MIIAKFNTKGEGAIKTLTLNAKAKLVPVTNAKSEKAPKFRIVTDTFQTIPVWLRKSDAGTEYLSAEIDDPALPAKLYVALFSQDDGTHNLVWNRPRPQSQYPTTQQDDDEIPF